jgi:hypothetical protein
MSQRPNASKIFATRYVFSVSMVVMAVLLVSSGPSGPCPVVKLCLLAKVVKISLCYRGAPWQGAMRAMKPVDLGSIGGLDAGRRPPRRSLISRPR